MLVVCACACARAWARAWQAWAWAGEIGQERLEACCPRPDETRRAERATQWQTAAQGLPCGNWRPLRLGLALAPALRLSTRARRSMDADGSMRSTTRQDRHGGAGGAERPLGEPLSPLPIRSSCLALSQAICRFARRMSLSLALFCLWHSPSSWSTTNDPPRRGSDWSSRASQSARTHAPRTVPRQSPPQLTGETRRGVAEPEDNKKGKKPRRESHAFGDGLTYKVQMDGGGKTGLENWRAIDCNDGAKTNKQKEKRRSEKRREMRAGEARPQLK